jgi:NAD(P)-dependent dehydrogenase (short-subunit alcohol dehydrogenase family)
MLLENQVALVSGAGSGIGRAIALMLTQAGSSVIAADSSVEAATETARLAKDSPGICLPLTMDVSRPEDHERSVAFAMKNFGALHIACNNAGISLAKSQMPCMLTELTTSDWEDVMRVNLFGMFYGMRQQIPQILRSGGGAIVNTASVMGQVARPGLSAYIASKHGVIGLTKAAAVEFSDKNIRINAVAPGYIETPILADLKVTQLKAIADRHPMRRLGHPEEVARMVVWLCSDQASFSTGSVYSVDGGYLAV